MTENKDQFIQLNPIPLGPGDCWTVKTTELRSVEGKVQAKTKPKNQYVSET